MQGDEQIIIPDMLGARREREPEAFERQTLIFRLLAAMVGVRLIYSIAHTVLRLFFDSGAYAAFPVTYIVLSYLLVPGMLLFAALIYFAGAKIFAYAAIFIGVYFLWMAMAGEIFYLITAGAGFLSVVMFIHVAVHVTQILVMLFIAVDRKYRLYMNMRAEVAKEMQDLVKAQKR